MNQQAMPKGETRPIERTARASGGPIDFDFLKRKSWPGVSAECVRIEPPAEYDFRLKVSSNFLMLLDLQRTDGETAASGVPRTHRRNLRHRLSYVPRECEISGWSRLIKPASFTAVYFDSPLLAENRCSLSQLPPMIEFEDHMLRTAMLQFDAILKNPALDQPGYAETLAILLAYELTRMRTQQKTAPPAQGGLPQRQVRTVMDYLEVHLADKTSVAELAALLDLSRFHFIRAFKKTVGMSPHKFILNRRIERARELLTDQDLSVGEVAERTGFNGPAQLTRVFRQIVGTTPTAFRRGE
jgi:AraC family transcriptional regulator